MASEVCNIAKASNSYIPPAIIVVGILDALFTGWNKTGTMQDQFRAFVYTAAIYGGASYLVSTVTKNAEPMACKM